MPYSLPMSNIRHLLEESADIVAPTPRPPGWWIMPASYMTAVLIMLAGYAAFGWAGLVALIAMAGCIQLGHRIGTGRWIDWGQ